MRGQPNIFIREPHAGLSCTAFAGFKWLLAVKAALDANGDGEQVDISFGRDAVPHRQRASADRAKEKPRLGPGRGSVTSWVIECSRGRL